MRLKSFGPSVGLGAGLLVALLAGSTASAAEPDITPAHVYQAVGQITADINLIRAVMGRPVLTAAEWIVEDAQPRHVYYQARTLFRKANRFAIEIAGVERQSPVPFPDGEIRPAHVFTMIKDAQSQIDIVRRELGIGVRAEEPAFESRRQPSDVLRATVQASRQLNLLLDREFTPEDVYGRLELAATYVAGTLSEDENNPVYGKLPPFEPAKVPGDVYRRVLECLQLTRSIGEKLGVPVLRLNLRRELRRKDISPADVYDLATTVLSELAHLTLELEAKEVGPPPIEQPKHIFPSHVYQMAGMLQDELARLEEVR